MMLDLKEKIGYLKKFKCGIFTTVWCYFLKILVKRVDHFLKESISRMFWTRQKERVPDRTADRYERYQLYCVYSAFISE